MADLFDQVVGPVPGLALPAVHQRVGKTPDMSAGHPDTGVHQNGRLESDVFFLLRDEPFPPGIFDIVLELHPSGAKSQVLARPP